MVIAFILIYLFMSYWCGMGTIPTATVEFKVKKTIHKGILFVLAPVVIPLIFIYCIIYLAGLLVEEYEV